VTLPDEIAELVEAAAEAEGVPVSTWVARATEREARRTAGRAALNEQLAEMGPIPEETQNWANELTARTLARGSTPDTRSQAS
jgi:hypothetical protein